MSMILDGSLGVTFNDASLQGAAASPYVLKNRIINGAMEIDQRNAGASVSISSGASGFAVDRFLADNGTDAAYTAQQVTDAPAGFNYSVKITVTTADASIAAGQFSSFIQGIEGYNIADLDWGTANAKTVTLSFWVKSSLTGTFGGSFRGASSTRSYPFTYTISTANTWEQKTLTVVGETTGTWLKTNGNGVQIIFNLGTGATFSGTAGAWASASYRNATGAINVLETLNATWQITGVQLEQNTSATPFERRLYDKELASCQRYYYRVLANGVGYVFGQSFNAATTLARGVVNFPTTMRTEITALEQSGTASNYQVAHGNLTLTSCSSVPTFSTGQKESCAVNFTVSSGLTAGNGSLIRAADSSAYLGFSAEI
jgi:hypothetical protein